MKIKKKTSSLNAQQQNVDDRGNNEVEERTMEIIQSEQQRGNIFKKE